MSSFHHYTQPNPRLYHSHIDIVEDGLSLTDSPHLIKLNGEEIVSIMTDTVRMTQLLDDIRTRRTTIFELPSTTMPSWPQYIGKLLSSYTAVGANSVASISLTSVTITSLRELLACFETLQVRRVCLTRTHWVSPLPRAAVRWHRESIYEPIEC